MDEWREADRQIIEILLESLERCISLALAQKAMLTAQGTPNWEAFVINTQDIISKRLHVKFEQFREILLLSSSEDQLPTGWLEIVAALLDSVNDPDLDG